MTTPSQTVDTEFLRGTVALMITIRSWGARKGGDMSKVSTAASKERLKITKELITAPELVAVKRYLTETKDWVKGRTMPFIGMKTGIFLARTEFVAEVERELPERLVVLGKLADGLVKVYPDAVERAREELADQFDERNYPSPRELRELFGVEWNWIAFSVPENLPKELREAQAAKLGEKFAEAEAEITLALREGFAALIGHAVERLKVAPGEKPKVFRDTLVGNLTEFIDTFKARNLTNDATLESLVAKAKAIVADANPDMLRKSDSVRESTLAKFEEVKIAVDGMVEKSKGRRFNFDE